MIKAEVPQEKLSVATKTSPLAVSTTIVREKRAGCAISADGSLVTARGALEAGRPGWDWGDVLRAFM